MVYGPRHLAAGSPFVRLIPMAPRRSARISAAAERKTTTIAKPLTEKKSNDGIRKTRKSPAKSGGDKPAAAVKAITEEASLSSKVPKAPASSTSEINPESSSNGATSLRSTPPPLDRPVDPHRTNATLLTPRGSSVVAYPPGPLDISPSKTGPPRPTATTGTLLEQAVAHLIKTDPRLKPLIEKYPCPLFSPEGLAEKVDPFQSLASSIIGQQVSGAAAKSIKKKFVALFNADEEDELFNADEEDETLRTTRFPTPAEVARCDIATLRTAGLSQRKAEYLQGLAEKFVSGELSTEMLLKASDEEVLEKLTAVRGLGKWSVEMFACFGLKRIDVFSTGDLGVQ